jgi:endonuclease YncB( thermonuclease family)
MGTLRIQGTIQLDQFWPSGDSDADTTKLELQIDKDSFAYRDDAAAAFQPTKAFEGAISKGQGTRTVIKENRREGTRSITIRLQGVDAPELHYQASALRRTASITEEMRQAYNQLNKAERRQCFAESATMALAISLRRLSRGNTQIPCTFESEVKYPFEVVDTYGRFVGDVSVGRRRNINRWLVQNGWAIPAFYTSMSVTEIEAILVAWAKGKKKRSRPAAMVSNNASEFDWSMVYRKPMAGMTAKVGQDKGAVLVPKFFRRQVSWYISRKAGLVSPSFSFASFLKRTPEQFVKLNDFLTEGLYSAQRYQLHSVVDNTNTIQGRPEDFVFQEKPATLVDQNNRTITTW